MNVLYEEEGSFRIGAILADNDTSLQVQAPHGKRSKVKASNVLFRFSEALSFQVESDLKNSVNSTSALGRGLMLPMVSGCFILTFDQ